MISSLWSRWVEQTREGRFRWFGIALFLTHVLTYSYWSGDHGRLEVLLVDPLPLCWSFFPWCGEFRSFGVDFWLMAFHTYLLCVLLGIGLLVFRRTGAWGCAVLAWVTLMKFVVLLIDYRLMGNYHYMPFLVTLAYLFLPRPQNFILYLIVGFYMGAGILKFNLEWLTGAALFVPSPLGGDLMELLLALAVVFELTGVLLLLAKRRIWVLGMLGVCVFFHGFSWHIVGHYYPLSMFALLTAFLLFRTSGPIQNIRWIPLLPLRPLEWSLLGVFAMAQVLPHLIDPRMDLTGRGRIFSLNMLDARAQCENFIFLRRQEPDGSWVTVESHADRKDLGIRIGCDPLVYATEVKRICEHRGAATISMALYSRRTTDPEFTEILDWKNACDPQHKINWWGNFD